MGVISTFVGLLGANGKVEHDEIWVHGCNYDLLE